MRLKNLHLIVIILWFSVLLSCSTDFSRIPSSVESQSVNAQIAKYLKEAPKVSETALIESLDHFMIGMNDYTSKSDRVIYQYKIVDQLEDSDKMVRVVPELRGAAQFSFTLEITREGLENPYVIYEKAVHLGQIKGYFDDNVPHAFNWIEIIWNAEAGSKEAQLILAQKELDAAIQVKKGVKNASLPSEGGIKTDFPFEGDFWDDKNFRKYIDSKARALEDKINDLKRTVRKEKKIRKKLWEKQREAFSSLEANQEKLNDLVARNDRKGVARLLEKYIPWPDMDPFEINVWRQWLDAIENPSKETVLAFRGLSNDYVNKGANGPFLFSKVITRNQGSYTRRLRSLNTLRNSLSNLDRAQIKSINETLRQQIRIKGEFPYKSLSSSLLAHMKVPYGTSFLSFSDFQTAYNFSGGNMAIVRIDKRRMLPNLLSTHLRESELITPLIVFPDEIVDISMYSGKENRYESVLNDVVKKLGMNPEDYDKNLLFWDKNKFWEDATEFWNKNLKPVNKIKPIGSCKELFGLFL